MAQRYKKSEIIAKLEKAKESAMLSAQNSETIEDEQYFTGVMQGLWSAIFTLSMNEIEEDTDDNR